MNDTAISFIRTYVPVLVGTVIAWLAQKGLEIDKDVAVAFFTALCIGLYYLAAKVLSARWPALGWLLGSKKTPVYVPPAPPSGGVEAPPQG